MHPTCETCRFWQRSLDPDEIGPTWPLTPPDDGKTATRDGQTI